MSYFYLLKHSQIFTKTQTLLGHSNFISIYINVKNHCGNLTFHEKGIQWAKIY